MRKNIFQKLRFSYVKDGVEHVLTTEGTQEKFEQVYNLWEEMDEKIDVCGIEEIAALIERTLLKKFFFSFF